MQHLVGDEVLAGAVGVHDCLDEVLRHVLIVGEQLLGVLGQAIATVTEAWIVVMRTDSGLKTYAIDNVAGIETVHLAVGVELVEVGDAKSQVSVCEELHRLRLGGS